MKTIILLSLLAISGCVTDQIPEGLYGCISLDGYFTDSEGVFIKIPEGTVLTAELIEQICP